MSAFVSTGSLLWACIHELQAVRPELPRPLSCGDCRMHVLDDRPPPLARGAFRFRPQHIAHATPLDEDLFALLGGVEHLGEALTPLRARVTFHLYTVQQETGRSCGRRISARGCPGAARRVRCD